MTTQTVRVSRAARAGRGEQRSPSEPPSADGFNALSGLKPPGRMTARTVLQHLPGKMESGALRRGGSPQGRPISGCSDQGLGLFLPQIRKGFDCEFHCPRPRGDQTDYPLNTRPRGVVKGAGEQPETRQSDCPVQRQSLMAAAIRSLMHNRHGATRAVRGTLSRVRAQPYCCGSARPSIGGRATIDVMMDRGSPEILPRLPLGATSQPV